MLFASAELVRRQAYAGTGLLDSWLTALAAAIALLTAAIPFTPKEHA